MGEIIERLSVVETKMDNLLEEFRRYSSNHQREYAETCNRNEVEHHHIWIEIDDLKGWKWKLTGAVTLFIFIWAAISQIITAYILKVIGI